MLKIGQFFCMIKKMNDYTDYFFHLFTSYIFSTVELITEKYRVKININSWIVSFLYTKKYLKWIVF
jgi:hypothetical protein